MCLGPYEPLFCTAVVVEMDQLRDTGQPGIQGELFSGRGFEIIGMGMQVESSPCDSRFMLCMLKLGTVVRRNISSDASWPVCDWI